VVSDWQPISTAPKDGTIILIFERRVGTAGLVRVSRWRDDTIPSGWTGAENPPSHWLPLPLPPKRLSFVAADPSWVPCREFEAPVEKDAAAQSLAADGSRETTQVPTMDEAP
jgi:hypothetical protein